MEYSYKFKHIENNLIKLLEIFLGNENLKKYLYYLTDDPLAEANVTANLLNDYIVLTPFDEEILSAEKVTMFINPIEGDYTRHPLSNIIFMIDVVIPHNKWLLSGTGKIRAFRIADEIAKDIDQQKVAGIGDVIVSKHKIFKLNKEFSGITLPIVVKSSTQKGA